MGRGGAGAQAVEGAAIRSRHEPEPISSLDTALKLAKEAAEGDGFLKGVDRMVSELGRRYGNPKIGMTRIVFDAGDHVIKVPYNGEGILANSREANWKGSEIPLARCEFITLHPDDGVMALKMEKVTPLLVGHHPDSDLPDWVHWVDGAQVGYNDAGELIAYDL